MMHQSPQFSKLSFYIYSKVLIGLVQDETDLSFSERELRNGISSRTKDRYLRTLVRNTFTFHLNEIFATVQNEYTDWTNVETLTDDFSEDPSNSKKGSSHLREFNPYQIQHETSLALTDKLYTAPIQQVLISLNRLDILLMQNQNATSSGQITTMIALLEPFITFRQLIGQIDPDIQSISTFTNTLQKHTTKQ